jgi:hypothetical protein
VVQGLRSACGHGFSPSEEAPAMALACPDIA